MRDDSTLLTAGFRQCLSGAADCVGQDRMLPAALSACPVPDSRGPSDPFVGRPALLSGPGVLTRRCDRRIDASRRGRRRRVRLREVGRLIRRRRIGRACRGRRAVLGLLIVVIAGREAQRQEFRRAIGASRVSCLRLPVRPNLQNIGFDTHVPTGSLTRAPSGENGSRQFGRRFPRKYRRKCRC